MHNKRKAMHNQRRQGKARHNKRRQGNAMHNKRSQGNAMHNKRRQGDAMHNIRRQRHAQTRATTRSNAGNDMLKRRHRHAQPQATTCTNAGNEMQDADIEMQDRHISKCSKQDRQRNAQKSLKINKAGKERHKGK
jgi:hypothetical protein